MVLIQCARYKSYVHSHVIRCGNKLVLRPWPRGSMNFLDFMLVYELVLGMLTIGRVSISFMGDASEVGKCGYCCIVNVRL